MYKQVPTSLNFVDREKAVEKFWEDNNIFKKSMEHRKEGETYTFYDGPPTSKCPPSSEIFSIKKVRISCRKTSISAGVKFLISFSFCILSNTISLILYLSRSTIHRKSSVKNGFSYGSSCKIAIASSVRSATSCFAFSKPSNTT